MIKMAIVGFGGMGGWHRENITTRLNDLLEVKGIYDVRPEPGEKAAGLGMKVYSSLEELLADPEIELVTVATPNNFHKEIVIAALKAGKNVVCEKPVTICSADLEEMIAVAKETGKLFSIHQNRRWDKDYRTVKAVIDSGAIGAPYFIESRVDGSRGGSMYGWRGHKLNGGGMLLDWGVHLIDQVMDMIKSPVVEVGAHLQSVFSPEVDDNIKVFLRFENKCSVVLEMTTNCFISRPRWHVTCENGTMQIDDWMGNGRIVQCKPDSEMEWGDDIVYTAAGPTRTMAPRPPETTNELPLPEVDVDWSDYYRNIVGVMNGTAELIVRPDQALRVMKVIDAAFKASETGVAQKVEI
ncbi:MAG: Gfo/Idh/MocA family oxidoreductase [Clostridia bacterium]|nr:Gfo/Idh/MocA family oxidoreductase [Clostridia bacterium]